MATNILTSAVLSLVFLSFTSLTRIHSTAAIAGVVTNEQKQPVNRAHLYTVMGEEEAFTNAKGEFLFNSSQTTPLKLFVQREGYEDKAIQLDKLPGKLLIVLKSK